MSEWLQETRNTISQYLKEITGDMEISAYVLRHSYVTNQVAAIVGCSQRLTTVFNKYQASDISVLTENRQFANPLVSLSKSMGHKSPSVTLRVYTHCSELFDLHETSLLEKIKDEVTAFTLGKTKNAFQVQKTRLGCSEAVVDRYISKSKLQTLETSTVNYPRDKTLKLDSLLVSKPSLLQLVDLVLVRSRNPEISITSQLTKKTFQQVAKRIVEIQEETGIERLMDVFSSAKSKDLHRAADWIQKHEERIESLLVKNKTRVKLAKQLKLFQKCFEAKSGKWVVLNENEVKSLTRLLDCLGVGFKIIDRRTSRLSTISTRSKNLIHDNHSANQFHHDVQRNRSGYELVLELDNSLKTRHSLNMALILISLFSF